MCKGSSATVAVRQLTRIAVPPAQNRHVQFIVSPSQCAGNGGDARQSRHKNRILGDDRIEIRTGRVMGNTA